MNISIEQLKIHLGKRRLKKIEVIERDQDGIEVVMWEHLRYLGSEESLRIFNPADYANQKEFIEDVKYFVDCCEPSQI